MQLVHAAGHPAKHLALKALSTQQTLFFHGFSQLNSFIPQSLWSLCFALAQVCSCCDLHLSYLFCFTVIDQLQLGRGCHPACSRVLSKHGVFCTNPNGFDHPLHCTLSWGFLSVKRSTGDVLQVTTPIYFSYPLQSSSESLDSGCGVVCQACAWRCYRQVSFPWPNWGTSHRHCGAHWME